MDEQIKYEKWLRFECPSCKHWMFMPRHDLPRTIKCVVCSYIIKGRAILKHGQEVRRR